MTAAFETSAANYEHALDLHKQGDLDGASAAYDAVLKLEPRHAGALHMRGVIHLQCREFGQAVELIKMAVAIDPSDAAAQGNLSSALVALRRFDEAIEAARAAVALNPGSADQWGNLGRALTRRSRFPEALEAYQRAVALQPDRPGLHSAVGYTLTQLERFEEALESHRRAIALAPDRPEYRNNMSMTLRAMKLEAEAEEALRSAIEGGLTDAEVRASLALLLYERGKYEEGLSTYRSVRAEGVDTQAFDSVVMFHQNHRLQDQPAVLKADAVDWARRSGADVKPFTHHSNRRSVDRPIRVGLVSGDLREHPVGRYLVGPLAEIDPAAIALYAYSAEDNDDALNLRFRELIPNWRSSYGVPDQELARRIHNDQIDVLFDLSGHTAFHRLRMFMYKPAPVAVTWLGYFATTGVEAIDYVLCNDWLLPPGEENQWVEKPWRLPSAHWCYAAPADAPDVVPTPALETGRITFGCYNNFDKVTADTIAAWSRILDAVPGSRLLLRSGNKKESVRTRIVEEFARHGHPVGERLLVEAVSLPYDEHMRSYGLLDVALDPFPYNGGTTTTEAIYMGVPVLALHGDRFVGHMSESNIRSIGLHDWVARDVDDYIRRAAVLTADIPRLAELRAGLRARALGSQLFDAKAFARDFEAAVKGMWAKRVEQQE